MWQDPHYQTNLLTIHQKKGFFSQGQLQLVSQIHGAFFLQNLQRKGKHVDIHKGLIGGGDSARERWDRRPGRAPDWWARACAF